MNKLSTHEKTQKMTQMALFAALIVVLQLLSALIAKFALLPVSITLTLVPLVIGACLWGPGDGAKLGFIFGVIVLINAIVGLDAGGNILWNTSPILAALLCLVKGVGAGFCAGLVAKPFRTRTLLGTFLAAATAPIVNTGIFLLFMIFGFHDVLVTWAGGSSLGYYVLFGLVGINFIIEFAVNLLLAPTCRHILNSIRKQHTLNNSGC